LLDDERSRVAVEVAERYADGLASEEDLAAAGTAAGVAARVARNRVKVAARRAARDAAGEATVASAVADGVAWAATTTVDRAATTTEDRRDPWGGSDDAGWLAQLREHATLLRDIFGNPFQVPTVEPSWLAWNDRCVERIAEGIYEGRRVPDGTLDSARLAILADALLDSGCDDEELLAHCRSAGPHVRGCWAVDLLLRRE
jgi:hypothetical protein